LEKKGLLLGSIGKKSGEISADPRPTSGNVLRRKGRRNGRVRSQRWRAATER